MSIILLTDKWAKKKDSDNYMIMHFLMSTSDEKF